MDSDFSADFFANNRVRLLALLEPDVPVVLAAHGQLQRSADTTFPFQQDSSFWYLTGIEEPDVMVVFNADESFAIVPKRDSIREAFDGAVDPQALGSVSGIQDVCGDKDGWKRLGTVLKKNKKYATLAPGPDYMEFYDFYTNPARARMAARIKDRFGELDVIDIRKEVAGLRMIKQPVELRALQRAIDITIDTILDITETDKLASYTAEYEIEADITRGFRFRGARGHGFDPIVASGANAATIHHVHNQSPLKGDEIVVVDISAEYNHYMADIARTISLNGRPSKRQEAVYAAVLEAQQYAYSIIKPGVLPKDYEDQVEHYLGRKMIELGIIKENTKEQVRKYYPHRASHFLGIDAHDAGDYTAPMAPGMVITVEPGIYIPEEGLGVRVEDDILITDKGYEELSGRLAKALSGH